MLPSARPNVFNTACFKKSFLSSPIEVFFPTYPCAFNVSDAGRAELEVVFHSYPLKPQTILSLGICRIRAMSNKKNSGTYIDLENVHHDIHLIFVINYAKVTPYTFHFKSHIIGG